MPVTFPPALNGLKDLLEICLENSKFLIRGGINGALTVGSVFSTSHTMESLNSSGQLGDG